MGPTASDTRSDTELVAAALDGDRGAFGAIYDRYSPTVFSVCSQMLGSRDDAEDATADVFLVAAERLGQLRDPTRLRYWLLSIARRNVYRRSSARSRVAVVAEVDTVSDALVTEDRAGASLEDADLVGAVRDAADGLDDGDRLVLELTLQGCEGADLAEVLGVAPNTASQAASRMRSRLERSIGALFVARQGRADCSDLDRLLADWDGAFSVLWRKRVARHVEKCDTCDGRARRVPAVLLQGVAGAAPAVVVPVGIRHRVVEGARLGGTTHAPWSESGFPPADAPARPWRRVAAVVGGLAVAVLALLFIIDAVGGDDDPAPGSTTTTASTVATVPSTTAVAPSVVPGGPPAAVAGTDTVPNPPSSLAPPTSVDDPRGGTPPSGGGSGGDTGGGGSGGESGGDTGGGGSGGGSDDPPSGGTGTTPPTSPPRPEPPARDPATGGSGGGGTIGPRPTRPPRFPVFPRPSVSVPTVVDPGTGGPVIP